jgi:hypothetical protein
LSSAVIKIVNKCQQTLIFLMKRSPPAALIIHFKGDPMKHAPPHTRVGDEGAFNLLLFPDDSSAPPEALPLTDTSPIPEGPPPRLFSLSLTQITADWSSLRKRLGRRRRVLEIILAAGQPIELTGHRLVVGFSPRRRFHQELLDLADYRSCVEEELLRTFQVRLSVVTMVSPANRHLPHQRPFRKTPA